MRVSHVIHACSERYYSTLSSPFHPTSSSSHSLSISCSSSCTSSTTLMVVVTLRTSPKRRWTLLTNPTSLQNRTDRTFPHQPNTWSDGSMEPIPHLDVEVAAWKCCSGPEVMRRRGKPSANLAFLLRVPRKQHLQRTRDKEVDGAMSS